MYDMYDKKDYVFKPGDVVMLRPDAHKVRSIRNFWPYNQEWKGKRMTIKMTFNSLDDELVCTVLENEEYWCFSWLKLVRQSRVKINKFDIGDWVILKEDINSTAKALNLMAEDQKTFLSSIDFKFGYRFRWKKRFMKVNYLLFDSENSTTYTVNENDYHWDERWLEKVE
jgi:hypothetical protein